MVCPKCRAQNVDDAKFCESCGARLELPKPSGSFCTSCGKPLKQGAKFCGSCGAPQTGPVAPTASPQVPQAPKPAPAPAPMPSPAPPPGPLFPPTSSPSVGSYGAPTGRRKKSACGITCIVLLVILGALGFAGYYYGKRFVLSRPEALVGKWKTVAGKNNIAGEEFAFAPADGGKVKLQRTDGKPLPVDIVFTPKGNQEFSSRVNNPMDPSRYADFTVRLKSFTELEIDIAVSGGTKETVAAERSAGP